MTTATEDQLSSLGDSDLADFYPVPKDEPALAVPAGLDQYYDEAPLVMGDDGDDTGRITKVKFRVDGNGDAERSLAALAPRDICLPPRAYNHSDPR
jgi:hypothetical protein